MLGLCFGSEGEALAVAARINAIHDRVHGRLPEAAGLFAAGTAYSAHDPALLTWVHATLLVMNLRVYELFVAPVRAEDKDRYCAEAAAIEGHLGIPEGHLPRTFGELQRYVDGSLASGEILVTDVARTLARKIVYPDAPRVAAPALGLMRAITLGLLPPPIRDGYGFPWTTRHEGVLRLSAGLVPPAPAFDAAVGSLLAGGARCAARNESIRVSAAHLPRPLVTRWPEHASTRTTTRSSVWPGRPPRKSSVERTGARL